MSGHQQPVTAGVDTHGDTHHAAVVDSVGRHLCDREFPATPSGYRRLVAWMIAGTSSAWGWKVRVPTAQR